MEGRTMTAKKQELPSQQPQTPERVDSEHLDRKKTPRVVICKTKNATLLLAEMPGVNEQDVDVTVEKNVLTIHGRALPFSQEGFSPLYAEFEEEDFEGAFPLSGDADQSAITATMKDGTLRMVIPKTRQSQAAKIEIRKG
jgi:HSP20 family protein